MNILTILYTIVIIPYAQGLIGFDCGAPNLNTSSLITFSLVDNIDCEFPSNDINSTETVILLLQIAEFRNTKVIQCKIEIRRTIFQCGIFSHLIPVENSNQEYIMEISQEQCNKIHVTGIFKYDELHIISNLKINSTTTKSIDFAGSAIKNTCRGVYYADSFGAWYN